MRTTFGVKFQLKTLHYRFTILGMVNYNELGEAKKLNFKIESEPSKGILGWVKIEAPKDYTIEKHQVEKFSSFGNKIAKFLLRDVKDRLLFEEWVDSEPEIFEDGETHYFKFEELRGLSFVVPDCHAFPQITAELNFPNTKGQNYYVRLNWNAGYELSVEFDCPARTVAPQALLSMPEAAMLFKKSIDRNV